MSEMIAKKDFLDPYASTIHVVGTKFELPDEPLCEYLVGMGTLDYAPETEPEPEPAPEKKTSTQSAHKPQPTKAELSSGDKNG